MKKCPFCAELIQDEANKCKHCGEWIKKESFISKTFNSIGDEIKSLKNDINNKKTQHLYLPTPENSLNVKHIKLYPNHITINNSSVNFSDIVEITYIPMKETRAFVSTYSLTFYITAVENGLSIENLVMYNLSSNDNLIGAPQIAKKKEFEVYSFIYDILTEKTFISRLKNYITLYTFEDGFLYDVYYFQNNGNLSKFKDDNLKLICNLYECHKNGNILLTYDMLYIDYPGRNILNLKTLKHLRIPILSNIDVFKVLLDYLLENKQVLNLDTFNNLINKKLLFDKK